MRAELLQRFFKGECSPKEVHEILVWVNSPEGKKEFQGAFEAFEHESISGSTPLDSHELFAKVYDRIKEETLVKDVINARQEASFKLSTWRRKRHFMFSRVAAAIALILISVVAYFYISDQTVSGNQEMVLKSDIIQTKSTEPGQKLTIHLSDGSVAILNANSSITYSREFSDTMRFVQMQGEVFFEVAKNVEKPFVVSTSQLNTTALGTSFNIKAYENGHQQVSLITGKVKVEPRNSDLVNYLQPGEEITLSNGKISKDRFDILTKVLWKEGIIYFDNTPLKECFRTLEQWYGVKIEVIGMAPSKTLKVSGRFDNDYLTNVLKSISYTHDFMYEIDEKRVHITFSH